MARQDWLEKELFEARRIAKSYCEDVSRPFSRGEGFEASKYKRRGEELAERQRSQMEEAAELLRRQVMRPLRPGRGAILTRL